MEHYVDRRLAAKLSSAGLQLARGCLEVAGATPNRNSWAARLASELRRSPSGGRQRADLLAAAQHRAFTLYGEVGPLLVGIANLLETPRSDITASALSRPVGGLLRSAYERAAVAQWLISDLRGLVLAATPSDMERNSDEPYEAWKARLGPALPADPDEFADRHYAFIDGPEVGRRLLIWNLDQLRLQRATWRAAAEVDRRGTFDWDREASEVLIQLDAQELAIVGIAAAAGWRVEPQRIVDGSFTPAHLLRFDSLKKERMPTFSELVGAFGYAMLSQVAHPSWDPFRMVPSDEYRDDDDYAVHDLNLSLAQSWRCLMSVQVVAAWFGPGTLRKLAPAIPPGLFELEDQIAAQRRHHH